MYEIINEVAKEFSLDIKGYTKTKAAFLLNTSNGAMILKKQHVEKERIRLYAEITEALNKKGFKNIEQYQTINGTPYLAISNGIYTLAKCGEGDNCDFTNLNQTLIIASTLAKMHITSPESINGLTISNTAQCSYYPKRLAEIRHIKKWMDKQSSLTDVDVVFTKNYNYFLNKARNSSETIISFLKSNPKRICLNEIKEDNIIIDNNKNATFINVEKFAYSLPSIDLCNLIRRYIKRGGDAAHIFSILDAYTGIRPIDNEEYLFIQKYLSFPHKFFSLANTYYNSRRVYNNSSTHTKMKNCVIWQNKIYKELSQASWVQTE